MAESLGILVADSRVIAAANNLCTEFEEFKRALLTLSDIRPRFQEYRRESDGMFFREDRRSEVIESLLSCLNRVAVIHTHLTNEPDVPHFWPPPRYRLG